MPLEMTLGLLVPVAVGLLRYAGLVWVSSRPRSGSRYRVRAAATGRPPRSWRCGFRGLGLTVLFPGQMVWIVGSVVQVRVPKSWQRTGPEVVNLDIGGPEGVTETRLLATYIRVMTMAGPVLVWMPRRSARQLLACLEPVSAGR